MEINVRFLENLRLEASFDDFKIEADQPIRYKGDGSAPSPFDYFLASSAMCAAYFVRLYCQARGIPTEEIRISQDNVIDPQNRYQQCLKLRVELPDSLDEKHRKGILASMERCSVKRVIQNQPEFEITATHSQGRKQSLNFDFDSSKKTLILGKDASLEETIRAVTRDFDELGLKIDIASWRNLVANVWSVHIRDASSQLCFTNGKGSSKESALCSALGEYVERLSSNYFYNDFYLGSEISKRAFVHYPDEKWFPIDTSEKIPADLMDDHMLAVYNPDGELLASHLLDMNSDSLTRGICAQPFIRQSDGRKIYVPVGLVGNLFVSNGMSAGNTSEEARVQALSEIFERAVKRKIIEEEISLPDVPRDHLKKYPSILEGIKELEDKGYPILVKDASLGGVYPVMCVCLMNPHTGGVFASFGAHPKFEVALERSLTELLQGRSLEGFNDVALPSFNSQAVSDNNNLVEHFIDSNGVISWKFFSSKSEYSFKPWNFEGDTAQEFEQLMLIFSEIGKQVYIADYQEFSLAACRILVPGYSEIYPIEDLVWDNTNKALVFRPDILNVHILDNEALEQLIERMEDYELDNYANVSELIGIAFDENSVWGQLDIGELKALIYIKLGDLEPAKECLQSVLTFNEKSQSRRLFLQVLLAAIEIELNSSLDWKDFVHNLSRMFGDENTQVARSLLTGDSHFYGLEPYDESFGSFEKHRRLIESYEKLYKRRLDRIK